MTNLTIEQILEQLKQETATEMGIELGAETSSRLNGSVGARMTQKLIALGKQSLLDDQSINNVNVPQYMYNQGNPPMNKLH